MKDIRCIFGDHAYSQASADVKAVDEMDGYLVCRVTNCCVRCGKAYENMFVIPLPSWLCVREDGEEHGW